MMRIDTINGCTNILLIGDALLVGGGAFYYFKTYKGGKSKAPKQSVSDDDEDDETEIEDPNDDEKSETDDTEANGIQAFPSSFPSWLLGSGFRPIWTPISTPPPKDH